MSRVWKAVGVRTDPAEERSPLEHLMQNSRLILAFAFGVCLIAATYIYDPSLVTGMVSPTTDSLDSAPYLSRPQDNPSNTALFSSRAAFILRKLTDAPQEGAELNKAEAGRRIVFGIGTGRCGTLSLHQLLSKQERSKVTDESRKPSTPIWDLPKDKLEEIAERRIRYLRNEPGDPLLVGDVWSAHLPYIDAYIKLAPETKVIALERDRTKVVESFDAKTPGRNHWQDWYEGARWKADNFWDPCFPTYNRNLTKREAIGAYWDDYHVELDRLVAQYPDNVRKYKTEELLGQSDATRKEMLRFIGVENPRVFGRIHINELKNKVGVTSRRPALRHARPTPANRQGVQMGKGRMGSAVNQVQRNLQIAKPAPVASQPSQPMEQGAGGGENKLQHISSETQPTEHASTQASEPGQEVSSSVPSMQQAVPGGPTRGESAWMHKRTMDALQKKEWQPGAHQKSQLTRMQQSKASPAHVIKREPVRIGSPLQRGSARPYSRRQIGGIRAEPQSKSQATIGGT
ncbi:hypothetical protein CYMTET_12106 [Cymbomonas tetramitiformis]|uniref:Sulfotransferase n=1 Tax=Cymbomonas tetramitiformis TaxID=36881 RepID=A0AAE0LCH1_9CHLO|nr:hypothetical protein CYMTET_12106 [Cymbomonas tetramitiformis]